MFRPFVFLLAFCVAACSESAPEQAMPARGDSILTVIATNAPLAFFASTLGDDSVSVSTLAPDGVDPADWEPAPEDVLRIQATDLLIINGAGYEPWLGRVSVPSARVVDSSAVLQDSLIRSESVTHQHGPEGEHSHGATAYTLWLDPMLALAQARSVRDALVQRLPEQGSAIDGRMVELEQSLRDLDARWVETSQALGERPLLFSHPVYQYLEHRYDLNGRSLHWEPDVAPAEAEWQALAELLEEHPADLMIWEQAPLADVRSRLNGLGLRLAVVEPGGASGC